ncbi:MAG: hypothetical protein ACI8P3_000312 [Saprospiraceae bacterium]|jgi:hypothetical protein
MKSRILFLFVFLCFCANIHANNDNPANPSVTATAETSYPLNKIFYNDSENHHVFVDFESITDDLVKLNIWRSGKIMMEDDIADLQANTIYEINSDLFRSGNYTIELVTLQGIKIHKKLIIE